MKSTREKVLQTLVTNPRSTIMEIANEVGINAISVRHHLTSLQAASLVSAEEERHGVGRPRLVYFLTDRGMEKFPTRYYRLTNNLLTEMKASMSEADVKNIFRKMAEKLSEEYKPVFKSLKFEEKLALLKNVMGREGYELTVTKNGEKYQLNEVSCPFYQIGKEHPEICLFDKSLIAKLLSVPEDKVEHIHDNEHHCAFQISKPENG